MSTLRVLVRAAPDAAQARPWALFDLQNDPGETKNVVDLHPAEVERLQEAIGKWWRAPATVA